jgi:hypothetical protein
MLGSNVRSNAYFMEILCESFGFKAIFVRRGARQKGVFDDSPNAIQMTFVRIIVGFVSLFAVLQTASAAEWRYCLAPSNVDHKIYFSAVFTASSDIGRADSSFEEALIQAGLHHDEVQCPRAGDEKSIMVMLQDAISFNKNIGRQIIYLRWEPTN